MMKMILLLFHSNCWCCRLDMKQQEVRAVVDHTGAILVVIPVVFTTTARVERDSTYTVKYKSRIMHLLFSTPTLSMLICISK